MTGNTRDTVSCELGCERLVTLHAFPLRGSLMAVEAIRIVVTAGILNRVRVGIGDVIQPVSEAVSLAFYGAGDSVCDVTGVALIL